MPCKSLKVQFLDNLQTAIDNLTLLDEVHQLFFDGHSNSIFLNKLHSLRACMVNSLNVDISFWTGYHATNCERHGRFSVSKEELSAMHFQTEFLLHFHLFFKKHFSSSLHLSQIMKSSIQKIAMGCNPHQNFSYCFFWNTLNCLGILQATFHWEHFSASDLDWQKVSTVVLSSQFCHWKLQHIFGQKMQKKANLTLKKKEVPFPELHWFDGWYIIPIEYQAAEKIISHRKVSAVFTCWLFVMTLLELFTTSWDGQDLFMITMFGRIVSFLWTARIIFLPMSTSTPIWHCSFSTWLESMIHGQTFHKNPWCIHVDESHYHCVCCSNYKSSRS